MEEDLCSLGISVDQGQGLASGMSKVSGDGLTYSAAAEDQSPSGWNGVGPRFAHGARPAAGVGTPSVNLSIHNLNRIDRFSLKGGWVVNLRQSEHLYFVRQSAVPTVESCLDK